jgi:hypothetical protein
MLEGTWVLRPGRGGRPEAFLRQGADRALHIRYAADRAVVRGVNTCRCSDGLPRGPHDYLGEQATLAMRRGARALATAITSRVLPTYLPRLDHQRERANVRAAAGGAQRADIEQLLDLLSSGRVRTSHLDAMLVAWDLHEGGVTAALYARREPDTVELTLHGVPVAAVRELLEATRSVLTHAQRDNHLNL